MDPLPIKDKVEQSAENKNKQILTFLNTKSVKKSCV